jgi:putative addiction module component (TIGR02574 family)
MTDVAKKLAEEALLLPREDRAELVDRLLQSLNIPTQTEIDQRWKKEVEKRVEEYESGTVEGIEGEQVFSEIRNRLKK